VFSDGIAAREIIAGHGLIDDRYARAALSLKFKSRPANSGVPSVSKYFSATQLIET